MGRISSPLPPAKAKLEPDKKKPLPLGWLLSADSIKTIENSIGSREQCPEEGSPRTVIQRNSCVLRQIGKDLAGGIEAPRPRPWTTAIAPAN